MSLLDQLGGAPERRCSLCNGTFAELDTRSADSAAHGFCWVLAHPDEPGQPQQAVLWHTRAAERRKTGPPERLYCLRRCLRMMPVEFDAAAVAYRCAGCNKTLWSPAGAAPVYVPEPTCGNLTHLGIVVHATGEPWCLSCAGEWPESITLELNDSSIDPVQPIV